MKNNAPLRVFYPFPEDFSVHRARTIQTLNTAAALAESGVDVVLFIEGLEREFDGVLASYYGITRPERLRAMFVSREKKALGFLPFRSNSVFFSRFVEAARRLPAPPDFIYCRHLKIAELLLRNKPFGSVPLAFESHEIFHQAFREEHDMRRWLERRKYRLLKEREEFVYRNADCVTATSAHLLESLKAEYGSAMRTAVVPHGTSFAGRFPGKTFDPFDNRVFYIGSFHPWKGVDFLIDSLQYPGMGDLVLVGPMEETRKREILDRAKRIGVAGRIEIRGSVPPSKMESVLREVHYAAIPNGNDARSRLFSSPLKLLDFMAAKAAVLAADHPALREILGQEMAGWAEPGNPRAFAEAFKKMKEDPERTSEMVRSAAVLAGEYSWKRRGERIRDLMADFILSRNPA